MPNVHIVDENAVEKKSKYFVRLIRMQMKMSKMTYKVKHVSIIDRADKTCCLTATSNNQAAFPK